MSPILRTFEDSPAVLTSVPLWVGVYGPTASGKTFSALRIATGMQRVTGGEVFMIDTEARRGLHYARHFKFRHVPFGSPFSPLDYLAAVEHCVSKGARVLVIDSMSHEHEGPGGVLEWHGAEVERLCRGDAGKADKVKMLAWQAPKSARRRMINTLLQLPINIVFCFRAKEKLKIVPGRQPEPLGFMPIAGDELAYEMTANALLMPGSNGVPTWQSREVGENAMIKRPEQFRKIIAANDGRQLNEDMGEAFARWASGEPPAPDGPTPAARILAALTAAQDLAAVDAAILDFDAACKARQIRKSEGEQIRLVIDARREALTATTGQQATNDTGTQESEPV